MQLLTFRGAGGQPRVGALAGDHVVDLSAGFGSLLEVITGGPAAMSTARGLLERGEAAAPLAEVTVLAPLPEPARNVFATGWNYVEHFDEGRAARPGSGQEFPEHPTFFTKLPSTVVAPYAPLPCDTALSGRMDYEGELAVVIGLAGRNIPTDRALEHVFGYTVANDVTARDIQRLHGGQWFRGKSIDGTCPMGPVLVTADEIGDPQDLDLRVEVNGQGRQREHTSAMAFPVATLLAELSRGITLLPGDLLLTGTPSGVGYSRDPAQFLMPGDEVVVSISRIGELRNRVESTDLSSYQCG